MKLLAYIRVSTDDQAEHGHSLNLIQPELLRRYCEAHGHTLVDTVCDGDARELVKARGVSAGTLFETRAGGKALMARLRRGEADGFVVVRLDRAFRDSWDALGVARWLRQRGLHLLSVQDPVDIHTRHGWMAFGVLALAAEYERGKICDRGVEVSAGLRAAGRVYGGVPYGCMARDGKLYKDPVLWPVRERIVTLRAQLSLRRLAKALQREGIRNPSGGVLWHVSTLHRLIEMHSDLQHIPAAPCVAEANVSSQARVA